MSRVVFDIGQWFFPLSNIDILSPRWTNMTSQLPASVGIVEIAFLRIVHFSQVRFMVDSLNSLCYFHNCGILKYELADTSNSRIIFSCHCLLS